MTAVSDFLKFAKEVRVKKHLRVTDHGTTLVDAYVREIDESEREGDEVGPEVEDHGFKELEIPEELDLTSVDMTFSDIPEEPPEDLKRQLELKERQARDFALWETWKSGGKRKEDLAPLLAAFKPLIDMKVNVFANKVRIPPSAIELAHKRAFVKGLETYNPERGSLGTYIYRYLDKAKRWIIENQNVGRVPENRAYKIGKYRAIKSELADKLGRAPNIKELSNELGWPVAEVDRMDSEDRADLVSQGFEEDPFTIVTSKEEEVLRLFKYELTPQQREVYEYLTGIGRPKMASTGDISKKMGIPDYQVSRIKNQIQLKLKKYIGG